MQPIIFRNEAEDYGALAAYFKKARREARAARGSLANVVSWGRLLVPLAAIGVTLFFLCPEFSSDTLANLCVFALPTVIVLLLIFFFILRPKFSLENLARAQIANMKDEERDMRLELSPAGFELHSKPRTTFFRWCGIEEIGTTPQHIFLCTKIPTSAIVVPKRAFADDEEFAEFIRTATRWRKEAIAMEGQPDTRIVTKKPPPG